MSSVRRASLVDMLIRKLCHVVMGVVMVIDTMALIIDMLELDGTIIEFAVGNEQLLGHFYPKSVLSQLIVHQCYCKLF